MRRSKGAIPRFAITTRCGACALFVLALFAGPGDAAGARSSSALQAEAQAEAEAQAAKIEKMLELARSGKPGMRSQAAERLVGFGAPALERVRALIEAEATWLDGLASLGPSLVEVLGEFHDASLRDRLWASLEAPEFPWRPAAMRALARTAGGPDEEAVEARANGGSGTSEPERFEAYLDDRIAAVRHAALGATESLPANATLSTEAVEARLFDTDGRVRRLAASILMDRGRPDASFWLFEELHRDDRFFGMRTGQAARFEAWRMLARRLPRKPETRYDARRGPTQKRNPVALTELESILTESVESRPKLPSWASAPPELPRASVGFELRSCRAGEVFLRLALVDGQDELWVGTGSPLRVPLEAGTVARMVELARAACEPLEADFFGELGCDQEALHLTGVDGKTRVVRISKGQRAVEDLRPASLTPLARAFVSQLPEEIPGDPRGQGLRARVLEAFEVLGGPLESVDR